VMVMVMAVISGMAVIMKVDIAGGNPKYPLE
jgi:hypothetical protein